MKIHKLTYLAFELNSALDTGKYADFTVRDITPMIEARTIFTVLEQRLAEDVDLSLLAAADREELAAEWADMYEALGIHNARRKLGVENSGICLLIAYLLEGIQRRAKVVGA